MGLCGFISGIIRPTFLSIAFGWGVNWWLSSLAHCLQSWMCVPLNEMVTLSDYSYGLGSGLIVCHRIFVHCAKLNGLFICHSRSPFSIFGWDYLCMWVVRFCFADPPVHLPDVQQPLGISVWFPGGHLKVYRCALTCSRNLRKFSQLYVHCVEVGYAQHIVSSRDELLLSWFLVRIDFDL